MPPTPARSMARRSRSGPWGSGRKGPGEGQGEVELVGRILVLGQAEHGILEGEQGPGVDLEGEVEVERAAAAVLGVEFHLPDLAERVGLDEVALVVHVESMVDRMVLEVGHVPGHIDDCHRTTTLPVRRVTGADRWPGAPTALR